jgi:hypothetical protein
MFARKAPDATTTSGATSGATSATTIVAIFSTAFASTSRVPCGNNIIAVMPIAATIVYANAQPSGHHTTDDAMQ